MFGHGVGARHSRFGHMPRSFCCRHNGTTNNDGNVGSNTNNNSNNATNLPKTGAATSVATVLALGSLLVGCGAIMTKKKED